MLYGQCVILSAEVIICAHVAVRMRCSSWWSSTWL